MKLNNIKYFFILIFLLANISLFAQQNLKNKINQLNEKGQKEGLWIDSTKNRINEIYYKNGIKSGVYKSYNKTRKLLVFGEYDDGLQSGIWYYFEEDGHLWFCLNDFSKNTYSTINEGDGTKYTPDYNCHMISYYLNGNIKEEGLLLWSEGESPESDFSIEYGEWKYYDENGNLTEKKTFK